MIYRKDIAPYYKSRFFLSFWEGKGKCARNEEIGIYITIYSNIYCQHIIQQTNEITYIS